MVELMFVVELIEKIAKGILIEKYNSGQNQKLCRYTYQEDKIKAKQNIYHSNRLVLLHALPRTVF